MLLPITPLERPSKAIILPNPKKYPFTQKYSRPQSSIITACLAVNPLSSYVNTFKGTALWDTGATNTVISNKLVNELNLKSFGKVNSYGVDGRFTTDLYLLRFVLPNNLRSPNLEVSRGNLMNVDILIGMDIISCGDFAICKGQVFSFCIPPFEESIDFVKRAENSN